jgi:hypothetical protein
MNALQIIIIIIIALSGYPIGLLLAYFTKEELKSGRVFFKLIITTSVLAIIITAIFAKSQNSFFLLSMYVFIFLIVLASFVMSKKSKN